MAIVACVYGITVETWGPFFATVTAVAEHVLAYLRIFETFVPWQTWQQGILSGSCAQITRN